MPRPSRTRSCRCSCRPCCWSRSSSSSSCPASCCVVAGDYQRGPGKLELADRADPLDLPLPALHQPRRLAVGRAQFADPLRRRGLRACPAQRRADRRACWSSPPDKVEIVRYHGDCGAASAAFSSSCCAGSRCAAPGSSLRFGRPRMTPAVRELVVLILPATVAAGVYQISQFFYAYFSTRLGEGALTNLSYADRLNQLPLSIIGTALGVAILPVDQPGDRPRRRGRGRRRPGPRLRSCRCCSPCPPRSRSRSPPGRSSARSTRAANIASKAPASPATSSPSSSPACPPMCWSRC